MNPIRCIGAIPVAAAPSFSPQPSASPAVSSSAAARNRRHPTRRCQVRKVDANTGLIVLRHCKITNLAMLAMTMGFDVADKAMLRGIKVGDKVKFQAQMLNGKATVT